MDKYNFGGVNNLSFKDFLRYEYKEMWPFYAVNNIYQINFMLRFEYLSQDLEDLQSYLPMVQVDKIPETKKNNFNSYREFYDKETKDIVEMRNLGVLHFFDYEF
jgi:hypothetical protein